MNSDQIFDYSNNFLDEIIQSLINLKIKKLSEPKNNDFNNKLKSILGKNFKNSEFENLTRLNDQEFKNTIIDKFKKLRKEKNDKLGEKQSKDIEKRIFLQTIDLNWKSHIQYLEQLRQVIGLRSYGQRDPLVEYKKEAFSLFENLLDKLKTDYITILLNLKVVEKSEKEKALETNKEIANNPNCLLILKKDQKISRNDKCEVTGKKFKNCCGSL